MLLKSIVFGKFTPLIMWNVEIKSSNQFKPVRTQKKDDAMISENLISLLHSHDQKPIN